MPELMLAEEQVPLGAKVNVHLPGQKGPDKIEGKPVVFLVLQGGIEQNKRFYPLDEIKTDGKDFILASGMAGWHKDVRFSPVAAYTPKDALVGGRYAVFLDGERMKWGDYHLLEVMKTREGDNVLSIVLPFGPSNLAGIPAHEHQLKQRLGDVPRDELVKRLLIEENRLRLFEEHDARELEQMSYEKALLDDGVTLAFPQEEHGLPSEMIRYGISSKQHELTEILDMLHRAYNDNLLGLATILKSKKTRYFRAQKLSPAAQLVRVDDRNLQ